jgi:hypothetical protein
MIEKQKAPVFKFLEFGADLKDVEKGEKEDFPKLDHWLKAIHRNQPAIFDLNGLEYIGYSYAKQTIRRSLQKLLDGRYNASAILLRYDGDDVKTKLDGISYALFERGMTCILESSAKSSYQLIGYLTYEESAFDTVKDRKKREKMRAIMELLLKKKELYTNEVAKKLALKLPYCNRLLDELAAMRLLTRVKEASPSGGPIYLNQVMIG